MLFHSLTRSLGIKDKHVEVFDSGENEGCFWFELHTKVRKQTCPKCKKGTTRVHGYRRQSIQGVPVANKKVELQLRKRRYRCMACAHTFFEKLPFVDRYQRHTAMLAQEGLSLSSEMSFTHAGRLVGVSTNRLLRMLDQRTIPVSRVLPRSIAIDEADQEKFQTIIVDVEKREIIDVLPDRRAETIEHYFKQCDTGNVEIVVMDLSKAFKEAVRRQLWDPLIIADRFYFMRQVYWAFDEIRREVQRELYKEQRIRLKRNKKVLWTSPFKLNEEGRERVEEILCHHPCLREAYELKNKLDEWFKTSDHENAKDGLEAWFELVDQSGNQTFKKVVKTFTRWKKKCYIPLCIPTIMAT